MDENPFISPDLNVRTALHGLKFYAGVKGYFSSKTSLAARVEFGTFEDEHFFVNKIDGNKYANVFEAKHDDGTLLTVSGEFKTNIVDNLDIILRAASYGWQPDSLEKAWHKPNMELGLRAIYKATRDLHFSMAFNILGERLAITPDEVKTLKPVYDFNIGANYSMNSRWHFFATVQNIFASKNYMLYNGYPMQGINARAGVGFSF
jgi:hypothetical protein